jgi:hypothetical protein
MFFYTNDILAIGENPKDILMKLNKYFKLKPDSIHSPDDYLGTKIKKTTLPNGTTAWEQSSSHYVWSAVKNLEELMAMEAIKLPKRAKTPMVVHTNQNWMLALSSMWIRQIITSHKLEFFAG